MDPNIELRESFDDEAAKIGQQIVRLLRRLREKNARLPFALLVVLLRAELN